MQNQILKNIYLVFLITILIVSIDTLADETKNNNTEKEKILALYDRWNKAVEASSIDGYVANLNPNIKLRPPGGISIDGKENYRVFLQPVFAGASYIVDVKVPHQITLLGDSALVEYKYSVHRKVFDKTKDASLQEGALVNPISHTSYIDVLTKDENGNWTVLMHSWSDWNIK